MGMTPQELDALRRHERGLPALPRPTVLDIMNSGVVERLYAHGARESPRLTIPLGAHLAVVRRVMDLMRPIAELDNYLRGLRGGPPALINDIQDAFAEALPILLMSPEQFGRVLRHAIPELADQAVAPLRLGRAAMERGDTLEASAQFTEILMRLVELLLIVRSALTSAATAPATAARTIDRISQLERRAAAWRPPELLRRLVADERGTVTRGTLPPLSAIDEAAAAADDLPAFPGISGEMHMRGRSMESGRPSEFPRLDQLEVMPDGTVRLVSTLGLRADQLVAARQVFGRNIDSHPLLLDLWNDAINPLARTRMARVRQLWRLNTRSSRRRARKLAETVYNAQARRFWSRVRRTPDAADLFRRAGMVFEGDPISPRGVPRYRHPTPAHGDEVLTLEHNVARRHDPTRAIDPANLCFSLGDENSVLNEFIRRWDPFQMLDEDD